MSSNIEGSDDRDREDELDLGQENEGALIPAKNGSLGGDGGGNEPENGTMAYFEEDLSPETDQDQTPDRTMPSSDNGAANLPVTPRIGQLAAAGSPNETASTPDDTPSLHGSILSPQSSSALALRASPRPSPSPSHRPFELRFQSRLSSSPLGFRPSSPFLSHIHSRKSSLTSRMSPITGESETPQGPWDVIRWTKLRKITGQAFSEVGKRNFGHPTCMAVSTSIVIGTSKGIILVFDYQQSLKTIIGTGTKGMESFKAGF
ncbi:hypothetical protein KXV55_003700 [Aspergillus fumigatus]|nr:hypothetical protein KXV55_003700 [Aspergillus fumigatus]